MVTQTSSFRRSIASRPSGLATADEFRDATRSVWVGSRAKTLGCERLSAPDPFAGIPYPSPTTPVNWGELGYNFAQRFPRIVEAIEHLPTKSCFIDGEAIVVEHNGLSVFDLLRYRQHDGAAILCAFDLIELDGKDLRLVAIERRKDLLATLLRQVRPSHTGITLNEHYEGDGSIIYKHACRFGCEGIVSKRLGSPYRSGRSDHWLKVKNPAAPAVRREAEEDWGTRRKARAYRRQASH